MQGSYDVFPLHPKPKIPPSFALSSVRLSSSVESDISIRVFKIFPHVERSILNSFR